MNTAHQRHPETAIAKDTRRRRMPAPPTGNAKPGSATPDARIAEATALSGLTALLDLEQQVREADTQEALYLLIANELRNLVGARQIFVFRQDRKLRMTAMSGVPKVNRSAPFVEDMERIVNAAGVEGSAGTSHQLDLPTYPYPALLWHSMQTRNGASLGGILLARDSDWSEADRDVISRVSDTCAHALSALLQSNVSSGLTHGLRGRHAKLLAGAGVIGLLAMLIPVPMSVIAPLEVVAQKPFVVAAPIDGVIEEVLVEPGDRVVKNQPLIRMGGMELRNKLEVATQQLQVSDARLKKATQMAFSNDEGRNELRLAMADLNLKRAEMNYAEEMFGQSVIRAERDGVAVLSDKQALYGKPVATGERIMQIADPAKVEIAIHLPVKDALVLRKDGRVKAFLDSDPVNSRSGRIVTSDYQALPINGDQLAFRVVARLDDATLAPPRLGVRGSARVYGDSTSLGFYLFRRPISVLRQWVGL